MCIASVADQAEHEHIVQDSCSDDGTAEWLPHDKRVKAYIEKDSGMYDAVNRGYRRAKGEILAYLNCDEQYLPGALKNVSDYFDQHPEVDVVFADFLVVDADQKFICYRKVQLPHLHHVMVSHLPTFTCATFIRRKIIEQGFFFDTKWRDLGDAEWVCRLLKAKVRMGVMRCFTTAFADTGFNMNLSANASRERATMFASAPFWARKLAFALVLQHRLRRLLGGVYTQGPIQYSVYTTEDQTRRSLRCVDKPGFLWKSRL